MGVNADALQLFYNGHRVSATDTPAELAMEDDDVLHAELVALGCWLWAVAT